MVDSYTCLLSIAFTKYNKMWLDMIFINYTHGSDKIIILVYII